MGKDIGLYDKESGDRNDGGERGKRRRRRSMMKQGQGVRGRTLK